MAGIDELLKTYPRIRPPLSPAHQSVYLPEYRVNRNGGSTVTGLVVRMESWMHRKIAERRAGGRILELGAGTLNHLPYEHEFVVYDFVEPFTALWENSPLLAHTRARYNDIHDIPQDNRYDRVLSIAVLEHLTDLAETVTRAGLSLDDSGVFQAGIPSEGGLLWGLAWRCVTGPAYRLRTGLDYGTLMRHEHVNRADEILAVVRHFFERVTIAWFPLPHLQLSFYIYVEAENPRRDVCREYLCFAGRGTRQ